MDEQHLDALPPVNVSVPQGGQGSPMGDDNVINKAGSTKPNDPKNMVDPSSLGPPPLGSQSIADDGVAQAQIVSATPQIADDNDLIEKEWVEKAKHIVEQTKADPHMQNEAITKMKLDYLKKRYNRDIKGSEG